ncbi:MAG TPA: Gfo/Idh/MocA family oxidoreductase [Mycobacteriales bacterium]|nr:Gfo/Idh/MocA family oxidoreductase [Mycobacteriales bacterium]
MPEPRGVLQIGAGGAGTAHMRVVSANPNSRLIAVADVAESAREAASERFAVPSYADYRELLERHAGEADIAIVVLPHDVYPDVIAAVAATGLHILKEKPFARNLADAQRMDATLQSHQGVYMTSGQRLFGPGYQAALELVAGGELGEIYLAEGSILYSWNPDGRNWGWRGDRDRSGGTAILDSGWHLLEALHAYLGQPENVYAATGGIRAAEGDWTTDDKGVLTLNYPSGALATAVACHVALPNRFELLLHGTRGNVEVGTHRLVRYDRTARIETREWPEDDVMARQFEYFLACVAGEAKSACDVDVSLNVQRVVEAAYRSAAQGTPQAI